MVCIWSMQAPIRLWSRNVCSTLIGSCWTVQGKIPVKTTNLKCKWFFPFLTNANAKRANMNMSGMFSSENTDEVSSSLSKIVPPKWNKHSMRAAQKEVTRFVDSRLCGCFTPAQRATGQNAKHKKKEKSFCSYCDCFLLGRMVAHCVLWGDQLWYET